MYTDLLPKEKTMADIPQQELSHRAIKMFLLGALVWDYTESVIDIAAQMRVGGPTKKLARAIRELRKDYDRLRQRSLDEKDIEKEWELAELFESINSANFRKLCTGLLTEIRHDTSLAEGYVTLIEAVQIAMTMLDTLTLYASQCDVFIRKHYPQANSILPDHFRKLSVLLPEYAGDCYNRFSQTRQITSRILLNEINEIEMYGD